jgi:hypothetical protein
VAAKSNSLAWTNKTGVGPGPDLRELQDELFRACPCRSYVLALIVAFGAEVGWPMAEPHNL